MKIVHYLIFALMVFAIGLALYIVYLLFFPLKPIVFTNSPFPVITKEVKRGGNLIYTASHCKYVNTPSEISRSLVDGVQISLPTITASVPKGCTTLRIMTTNIPEVVPAGEYYLNITLTYKLNPFRQYVVHVRTQKFKVVE